MYPLSDEQRMLVETVSNIANTHFKPKVKHWDTTGEPPVEHVHMLAKEGFLAIGVPEEYGGVGASTLDIVLLKENIAKVCPNTALLVGGFDGAVPRAILALGTEEQKRRYLPRFVTADCFPAWGMSEPGAGSDVGGMVTRAVKTGDRYVINGSKVWITAAQVADLFLVFARLNDEKGLDGVGALLVEKGTPGFTVGKHIETMGLRATGMAELFFNDCEVPEENLLIRPGGMKDLLSLFNVDRVAANPPVCLGAASGAFEMAVEYLKERRQFGQRLSDFQGLQWRVSEMAIDLAASRSLLYQAASAFDRGEGRSIDSSIAKTYANEMAVRVTQTSIQMLGAAGITKEHGVEQFARDVRGLSFGYGSTEIHRNQIARNIFKGVR